jgi:[protein-PII] uridylyltransferase
LMVLRNMRRLVIPRFSHEFPFCHELARDFEDVHLLYLACLFHDIAKGRGGDHSELGMRDARKFCKQLGLNEADGELVAWLVDMHLVMSQTAQKQDLADPEVIAQFASRVVSERRLVALYLLTVADIRGTSPHVWNGWKAKLLEELFRTTRRLLRGDSAVNEHWLDYKKSATLEALKTETTPAIWRIVDDRYFQRVDVDDLTWHAEVIGDELFPKTPRVFCKPDNSGDALDVLVMASDRAGLFARITSAFERMQLDIGEARIYTTLNNYALDTFLVVPKTRFANDPDALLALAKKIERDLARALADAAAPSPASARQARQAKHFPLTPEINIRPARRPPLFEMTLTCSDRPGLLSSIAKVLHEREISIHDARITTLGSRVEDTFVIESAALNDARFTETLKESLAVATQ